jgi:ribosome biogenesis GTPase
MTACIKLKREFAYLADRQTMKPSAIEKARWKNISTHAKNLKTDMV